MGVVSFSISVCMNRVSFSFLVSVNTYRQPQVLHHHHAPLPCLGRQRDP